jgi:hypothetical protein
VFVAIPAVSALEEIPTVPTVSYQGASPLSPLQEQEKISSIGAGNFARSTHCQKFSTEQSGWWFGTLILFSIIYGNNHPN